MKKPPTAAIATACAAPRSRKASRPSRKSVRRNFDGSEKFLRPHPEERPKAASRRMGAAVVLRDARKSGLLRIRSELTMRPFGEMSSPSSPTKHSGNTIVPRAIERAATSLRHTGRDTTTASRQLDWRTIMLRKITLGLIVAASLSVAALAPGSASAHGFHSGWGYGGWGYGGPGLYINTGVSNCYRQQMVQT